MPTVFTPFGPLHRQANFIYDDFPKRFSIVPITHRAQSSDFAAGDLLLLDAPVANFTTHVAHHGDYES